MQKDAQADVRAALEKKGVGGGKQRVDSNWNYLELDPWKYAADKKPFGGYITKKALWEQAPMPKGLDTNGPGLAATHKHLAIPSSEKGSRAIVLEWKNYHEQKPDVQLLSSPNMKISDMQFSPHSPNILCASSVTGQPFRVWDLNNVVDNGTSGNQKMMCTAHSGFGVARFQFNPVVPGILASVAPKNPKNAIELTDIEMNTVFNAKASQTHGFKHAADAPTHTTSLSWGYEGNTIGYIAKTDICLMDLREASRQGIRLKEDSYSQHNRLQVAMVGHSAGPCKPYMVTSGFEVKFVNNVRTSPETVLKLWDMRQMNAPIDDYIMTQTTTNASDLHVEPSTGLLFVIDKKSHGINVFDLNQGSFMHLGNIRQRGDQHTFYTMMDRKYCDPTYGEFSRFVTLNRDYELGVERVFQNVRENQAGISPGSLGWNASMFPECMGCQTPIDSASWVDSGYKDIPLTLKSMEPGSGSDGLPECLNVNVEKGTMKVVGANWDSGKLAVNKEIDDATLAQRQLEQERKLAEHYLDEKVGIAEATSIVKKYISALNECEAAGDDVVKEMNDVLDNLRATDEANETNLKITNQKDESSIRRRQETELELKRLQQEQQRNAITKDDLHTLIKSITEGIAIARESEKTSAVEPSKYLRSLDTAKTRIEYLESKCNKRSESLKEEKRRHEATKSKLSEEKKLKDQIIILQKELKHLKAEAKENKGSSSSKYRRCESCERKRLAFGHEEGEEYGINKQTFNDLHELRSMQLAYGSASITNMKRSTSKGKSTKPGNSRLF